MNPETDAAGERRPAEKKSSSPRALRADAQLNRTKILEAAQEVFAARGLSAPIDEIARRAGVGVGTVYRHFPTKEALFEAIVASRLEEMASEAKKLADAEDPEKAFFTHVSRIMLAAREKRDFVDALSAAGIDVKTTLAKASRNHWKNLEHLLVNAQKAGAVRADIGIQELKTLLTGLIQATDFRASGAAKVQERLLSIVCDGLRPAAR